MTEKIYSKVESYCPVLDDEHKIYKEGYEAACKHIRRHLRKDRITPIPHEIDVVYKKALSRLRECLDLRGIRMPHPKYPVHSWSEV
jgi:hypothetical protein